MHVLESFKANHSMIQHWRTFLPTNQSISKLPSNTSQQKLEPYSTLIQDHFIPIKFQTLSTLPLYNLDLFTG